MSIEKFKKIKSYGKYERAMTGAERKE